ncbi:RidA family protein [Actinoplanes sp. NPDC049265]|uniref:RidA family protein n=1 Tax=Actinoplanes sp. NPDC049265 TaxID=3363902 RepID=UPI00371709B6
MIVRNPETVHAPLADYSHQVEVPSGGRWLVLSGQIGMAADRAVPADPVDQLRQALDNVAANLAAAGMAVSDLVKLTYYLVGDLDPAARRQVVGSWLGGHRPGSTVLYVSGLATPELRVEIDAWAYAA